MSNQVINTFIIEASLINPIKDIIYKLETGNFRDCDVKWLNDKLKGYTQLALDTLHQKIDLTFIYIGCDILNESVKKQFLDHFNIILSYFKTF